MVSKGAFIGVAALLAVLAIGLGVFAFMQTGKLNDARLDIANLEQDVSNLQANVTTLEGQLATEKTNVANLNTQLTAEKTKSANLQTELNTTKATLATAQTNLTTAQGRITTLEGELNTSKARVTTLEGSLATANAKVTSLTSDLAKASADLAKANADLATANAQVTTLTGDLNKIKAPRHFTTEQELAAWLAKDDTNTNPKYAAYDTLQKSYVLQVKAARDGFVISVSYTPSGSSLLVMATAIAGNTLYAVSPSLDIYLPLATGLATPSTPLPME